MMAGERWDFHWERRAWERLPGADEMEDGWEQEEDEMPEAAWVDELVKELD